MSTERPPSYERVGSQHAEILAELFDRVGCPCYCRYWDFPGDRRQWQDRSANGRHLSRQELLTAVAANDDSQEPNPLTGVVALDPEGRCVGWMRLEWSLRLPKLYQERPYRGLPCLGAGDSGPERSRVLTVACFLVDDGSRRQGVARGLLARGITLARELGATALEAFPRRAEGVSDEEHWLGPPPLYEGLGFHVLDAVGPYPVLRLSLE